MPCNLSAISWYDKLLFDGMMKGSFVLLKMMCQNHLV